MWAWVMPMSRWCRRLPWRRVSLPNWSTLGAEVGTGLAAAVGFESGEVGLFGVVCPGFVADHTVTVISKTGYHVLGSHTIDPDRNYWRNQQKRPGRWLRRSVTDDATQM